MGGAVPRLVLELYVVLLLPAHRGQVRPFSVDTVSLCGERELVLRIGPLIMLVFFGMLVVGLFYVYLFIPETKGITLEEVRAIVDVVFSPYPVSRWLPPHAQGGCVVPIWRPRLALDGMEAEREALSPPPRRPRGTREACLGIRGRGGVTRQANKGRVGRDVHVFVFVFSHLNRRVS